jgi:hypothetical protein
MGRAEHLIRQVAGFDLAAFLAVDRWLGGRVAVAALLAIAVASWGVSPVLLVFFVSELGGAMLQWRALRQLGPA